MKNDRNKDMEPETNMDNHRDKNKERLFIFFLLASSVFLLFYGLGTRYLWQDEAQTPLIARTILHTGFPYGTYGVNFFSQDAGAEYGHNYLWKWHPWLPFYAEALSIKFFGEGNFAYRLPFAFFGLASILLVYFMMKRLTGSWREAAFCAASVAFSTAFLLLARQCRYYSMEMFFSAGAVMFYVDYLVHRQNNSLILLFLFMTCIFHTLYVYFFIILASIILHQLLFVKSRRKNVIIVISAVFLFNLPFLFTLYGIDFVAANGGKFDIRNVFGMFIVYISYALKYLFPYFLLFLSLLFFGIRAKINNSITMPDDITVVLAIFSAATLLCIPVLTSAPYLRNITGAVIPLAVLSGILCSRLFDMNKPAGIALALLVVFNSPFIKFVHEKTIDWDEAGECIVKFINANSVPGDEVLITYPDLPVKLYTKLKVHGGVTGEDISNIKKPDFVVIRKTVGLEYQRILLNYVLSKLNVKDYARYELPCADRTWENREDIAFHDFGPDNKLTRLYIYKLIKENHSLGVVQNAVK